MTTPTLTRINTSSNSTRALLNTSKPILKKPTPLPLSPSLSPSFSAAFITPSVKSPVKSPHVHFAPSPCLVSTFITHSPNTYDRAPIAVSPNPLAPPVWGDRVYSPSIDGFKTAETPNHVPLVFILPESPRLDDIEDPRSPPPLKVQTRNAVHFGELPKRSARIPTELSKAFDDLPSISLSNCTTLSCGL